MVGARIPPTETGHERIPSYPNKENGDQDASTCLPAFKRISLYS